MRLRRRPGGVKVSTLSRHVRGLGFDSRVRTPFSIYLCCIYLVFFMNKGKHKVNTTMTNRIRSPDSGIEPETSDMPGKRANLYTTRTST